MFLDRFWIPYRYGTLNLETIDARTDDIEVSITKRRLAQNVMPAHDRS